MPDEKAGGTRGVGQRLPMLAASATATRMVSEPEYEQRPAFDERALRLAQRTLKPRVQRLLWMALGALGYLARDRSPCRPPLRAGDPLIRRILVVRVDLLGDVVLTTPAVRALRRGYPAAQIDMLVAPAMATLLAGEPDIGRVLTYDPNVWTTPAKWLRATTWRDAIAFYRQARAPRYDLAISVNGDIGSIVTRATGARRRVGYAGEAYPFFMTDPVAGRRYQRPQHEVRYVLDLARAAGGVISPEDANPRLTPDLQACRAMAELLQAECARLGVHGPIIALHPGARNGRAKRWPLRHYATLSDQLAGELGALVVLTGAPNETAMSATVARQLRYPVLDLTGKTTLPELVALLAVSDVVVTGDSGPMHIACAVNTPVVALHGPTDPGLSGPTAPDAIILRHRLWCSPCYDASATAECRFGNPVCMKELAPHLAFDAVQRRLA